MLPLILYDQGTNSMYNLVGGCAAAHHSKVADTFPDAARLTHRGGGAGGGGGGGWGEGGASASMIVTATGASAT